MEAEEEEEKEEEGYGRLRNNAPLPALVSSHRLLNRLDGGWPAEGSYYFRQLSLARGLCNSTLRTYEIPELFGFRDPLTD